MLKISYSFIGLKVAQWAMERAMLEVLEIKGVGRPYLMDRWLCNGNRKSKSKSVSMLMEVAQDPFPLYSTGLYPAVNVNGMVIVFSFSSNEPQ